MNSDLTTKIYKSKERLEVAIMKEKDRFIKYHSPKDGDPDKICREGWEHYNMLTDMLFDLLKKM